MCVYFHHQSVVLYNLYNGTDYLRVGAEHALELLLSVLLSKGSQCNIETEVALEKFQSSLGVCLLFGTFHICDCHFYCDTKC